MSYIVGLVIPVPTANREAYLRQAKLAAEVLKDHGALSVVECWGDDIPPGEVTSFPMAVKCKADETVVFAWITWPSKETRDEGTKKFGEDPRMQDLWENPSFDHKRLIFGGFDVILDA